MSCLRQAPWPARRLSQPGCRALIAGHYGIGAITAPTILAELGDARRFAGGDQVVRVTGLDITVYASDGKRSPGHLSRQGPEVLRWALFEAAKAAGPRSPDYAYYTQVKARQGGNRATLAVARKLARRVRHTLLALGDAALAPRRGASAAPARGGLTVAGACPPTASRFAAASARRAPAATAGPWTASKDRAAAHHGDTHRSSCRRTLMGPRTQIRLGACTHEPVTTTVVRG
jgi:hypothetical protein